MPEQEEMRPYYGNSDVQEPLPPRYHDSPENASKDNSREMEMHSASELPLAEAPAHRDPVEMPAYEPPELHSHSRQPGAKHG